MPLETAEFISELNPTWPVGTDGVNTSDDHHRNTKRAVFQSFPNIAGPVEATHEDLNKLAGAASVGSGLNPVGTIIMYWGAAAPDGYLLCNGATIPAQYAELIALVGNTTPDLRGQFVRGWSTNANIDPDGPRAAGSNQNDAVGSHQHTYPVYNSGASNGGQAVGSTGSNNTGNPSVNASGGPETRPKNVAVLFCIKW